MGFYYSQHRTQREPLLHVSLLSPSSKGVTASRPGGCCTFRGFLPRLRNQPQAWATRLLKGAASKPAQSLPGEDVMFIILVRKPIAFCPQGATVSAFWDLGLHKHPWKDSLERKRPRGVQKLEKLNTCREEFGETGLLILPYLPAFRIWNTEVFLKKKSKNVFSWLKC